MARNPARPRTPARPNIGIGQPRERFSIIGFFGEVWAELGRVTWPTRQEATRLTVLVLSISIAFGIFLGLADMLFSELFKLLAGT
jgi:preprotein translocase subunit SecE